MASKVGHLKPFYIDEKKEGPNQTVSDATFNKWQGSILANIRKEEKWATVMTLTWQAKKVTNRGVTAENAHKIDLMLAYIAQYAPSVLYRDITQRATKDLLNLLRSENETQNRL